MENESSQTVESEVKQIAETDLKKEGINSKSKGSFIRRNPVLFTALMGLLAVVIVYFWKDWQSKSKVAAIEKMATEQLMGKSEELLKLAAKPFVWSIRAEMLRENMDQVNSYTKEMVREKNFQIIYLIDPQGKIVISTDKKLEGLSANSMFEAGMLQTDSIMVLKKDELLTVAAPVMGYDKKLGVLIMSYLPEKFGTEKISKTDTLGLTK